MATYRVQVGAAGGNGTLPTLHAAAQLVAPGDVVEVGPGVYHEVLEITTPRTTWRSIEPGAAILDGRYGPELLVGDRIPHLPAPASSGYLPNGQYAAMVKLAAPGVVVDGFTVRNVAGRGIVAGENDCIVRNCRVDFAYGGGIMAGGPAGTQKRNITVEGCVFTRLAMCYFDPERPGVAEAVPGSANLLELADSVFRGNTIAYGYGEGLNIGRGSDRILAEGNVIHTLHHLCLYFNRTIGSTARGNVLLHLYDPRYEGRPGAWPHGVVFGDERQPGAAMDKAHYQRDNTFEFNVVIGLGTLLSVRNNQAADGYDTQLLNCRIAHNTFVALSGTDAGIVIQGNLQGRAHRGSVFEGNVIHFDNAKAGAEIARGQPAGIAFQRNAWTRTPPAGFVGAGDVVGEMQLAAPGAALGGMFPDPFTTYRADNYRPLPLSPLVGAGPDGSTIGALAAASDDPPPPPPPPPVDWPALIADAQAAAGEVIDLTAHGGSTLDELARLMANVAVTAEELREINRHAGEARLRLDALLEKIAGYQTG